MGDLFFVWCEQWHIFMTLQKQKKKKTACFRFCVFCLLLILTSSSSKPVGKVIFFILIHGEV